MQANEHNGPIKSPKQLLLAVFFSFVVPVFAIIGLVAYVVAENKPSGSRLIENYSLGGVGTQDLDRGVMERIRKVGSVEIRDANRPLKAGLEVFNAQCTSCHTPGVAGAPKLGDEAAWSARIRTGFETLVGSALKGKGAMPPQGGGDFDDIEIARAVAYMANAAGAKFAEPARPAALVADAAAGTVAPGMVAVVAPQVVAAAAAPVLLPAASGPAPAVTGAPQAAPAMLAAAGGGEALYKQACSVCHAAGVANAPKFGDKAAWAPRIQTGVPQLVQSVVNGKGAMPPKGGSNASENEIRAAVEYMVSAAK